MLRVFPEIFKDKKLIFVGKVFFLQETNRLIMELNFSFGQLTPGYPPFMWFGTV